MPMVRISFRAGKSIEYRRAVADEVHRALVEVASVPELDRFQVLTEHAPADLIYDPTYLGVQRTDDIVMIQITLNQRPQQVKVALYKAVAARLAKNPGMRPEDVLISLVSVAPEDWSFGEGKAQYVKADQEQRS
ncbi:MAG TPA: tautomerase family protein [Steroidobacteraceae bacterium]|jgi:phenylpyruvate tautomerase PptA (4-oxalocrotonate tautomerase family)|nr:tautomerase family protein [Steroidobacteraceae bacterium]